MARPSFTDGSASASLTPSERLDSILRNDSDTDSARFEDLGDEDESYSSEDGDSIHRPEMYPMSGQPAVPNLYTSLPPLRDFLTTETSIEQDQTVANCLPLLKGQEDADSPNLPRNEFGIPKLDRERHKKFLEGSLGRLPAKFVSADPSRPWFLYWALLGLSLLGEDVSVYRERVISTVLPLQNASGGFGGGHGHTSHSAPTYAVILSLAIVGGDEALEIIDRRAMWHWLGELKQADGGFTVSVNGEEDLRGSYCALTIISLLNLPIELPPNCQSRFKHGDTLLTGLAEYVSKCQTYEGGISSAPDVEAHGGYAFCALGTLCLMGDPTKIVPSSLNVPRLISWLSARQYAPEGGFSGRTNKLVDVCYSWWVGGCFPLIEAVLNAQKLDVASPASQSPLGSIFSREGLMRYILSCCQGPKGGIRDKPTKSPDSYHTGYALAGLSLSQNYYFLDPDASAQPPLSSSVPPAFSWTASKVTPGRGTESTENLFNELDRVAFVHPVYVLPWGVAERTREWFEQKAGF